MPNNIIVLILCVFPGSVLLAQQKDTVKVDSAVNILAEVTVTATRLEESLMRSPVSVQKVAQKYFAESASVSFFDALEHLQGVQMITPSMGFRVLNARGFANTTNVRFAQLVDGLDVQSPHIGGPIANALGPSDLDVDNVEIVPGVASALYGMNTVNGLANITTKNPFLSQGLSVQQKTAVTHIGDINSSIKPFTETSLRWAKALNAKWAFKVNGSFTKGYDWIANDHTDLNGAANVSTGLTGNDNPAKDPVSSYGNESSDRKTIMLQGKSYVVARTGYDEKDVVDYTLQNIKADAGIYYKVSPRATLVYTYHMALLDNVYQRANRFGLQDYLVQQHGLQYQGNAVQARVYVNSENTGNSYNLRSMAENIDRNFKPDTKWYADYGAGFNSSIQSGSSVAQAHAAGRTAADAGRYQPGTAAFTKVLQKLQQINNWDSGAALKVQASFVHAEGQADLTSAWLPGLKKSLGVEMLVGADHRTYIIVPDGNYFINPGAGKTFNNIYYSKTGGFVSVTKAVLHNGLKLGATLRADKSDYFPLAFSPRFTAVYAGAHNQFFRLSFQSGYRYPSIFEGYSNVNSGGVKRVGGLPVMSKGIFETAWLQSSIAAFQQAVLNDVNTNGLSQNAAIQHNAGLLKKNPYTYIQPEHVNSIEGGYKGVFASGKLLLDADFYFNSYRSFIAQANMNVPKTQNIDSIPIVLYSKSLQSPYRMWTNSQTKVYNYGVSAGVTYTSAGFAINANATCAKLRKSANEDGLEDGFNTPGWMANLSLSKSNIFKNTGACISLRWQSSYYWQSFLVNGNVPAYATVDAQVTHTFTKTGLTAKLGANNLLNRYYNSFLGGPSIGGLYYITITYGLK